MSPNPVYLDDMKVTAECPHCDRTEEFADELTARAWMNGHIQSQHTDKLPKFINDE